VTPIRLSFITLLLRIILDVSGNSCREEFPVFLVVFCLSVQNEGSGAGTDTDPDLQTKDSRDHKGNLFLVPSSL
jgi:hypothetical protein